MLIHRTVATCVPLLLAACGPKSTPTPGPDTAQADVIAVEVSGGPESWSFAVTLRSPDTGCDAYADWWEVLDADGQLVDRRILGHSHVDEQPFTRNDTVAVAGDTPVWVRAHFRTAGTEEAGGYGGQAMTGTAGGSFAVAQPDTVPDPDGTLATEAPLPDGCAF